MNDAVQIFIIQPRLQIATLAMVVGDFSSERIAQKAIRTISQDLKADR